MKVSGVNFNKFSYGANIIPPKPLAPAPQPQVQSEHKKKSLFPLVAAIAIGAVVIGGIMFKGKSNAVDIEEVTNHKEKYEDLFDEALNIKKISQEVTEKSKEILVTAKAKWSEFLEIIEKGKKNNFEDITVDNKIIKFGLADASLDKEKTIPHMVEEFDKDNNLTRKITTKGNKTLIEEYKPSGLSDVYEYTNGKIYIYAQDAKITDELTKTYGQEYRFLVFPSSDSVLDSYSKNIQYTKEAVTCEKDLRFHSKKLQEAYCGYNEQHENDFEGFSHRYVWDDTGRLDYVALNGSYDIEYTELAKEKYFYNADGSLRAKLTNSIYNRHKDIYQYDELYKP